MKFDSLLSLLGNETVFTTGLLLSGNVSPAQVRLQLDRWVKNGSIVRLRRGLYALAAPYAKTAVHPFYLANRLCAASYVSLQSALSYYGMIPEYVPVTTSVTSGRPGEYKTFFGTCTYRHIKASLFNGYMVLDAVPQQQAFVASPEKALLDLLYLTPHSDDRGFVRELRLQNTDRLNLGALDAMIDAAGSRKLTRAYTELRTAINEEEYDTL